MDKDVGDCDRKSDVASAINDEDEVGGDVVIDDDEDGGGGGGGGGDDDCFAFATAVKVTEISPCDPACESSLVFVSLI